VVVDDCNRPRSKENVSAHCSDDYMRRRETSTDERGEMHITPRSPERNKKKAISEHHTLKAHTPARRVPAMITVLPFKSCLASATVKLIQSVCRKGNDVHDEQWSNDAGAGI
jgi:hypothetical protein